MVREAHPIEHCRPPDWDEFQKLQQAADGRIKLVTLSAEFAESPAFIASAVKSASSWRLATCRPMASKFALRPTPATLSTHLGNGSHRMLRRHPNYLWHQLAEDRLTASLIVDGHHLPPEVVKTFVRAKTPARCILVSDVSGLAGLPPGKYATNLCDLEILPDGRLVIAGQDQLLAGASLPIGVGVVNVMRFVGVDLHAAVDMASRQPVELLGLAPIELAAGHAADLVLFDLVLDDRGLPKRLTVRSTIVDGQLIFDNPHPGATVAPA